MCLRARTHAHKLAHQALHFSDIALPVLCTAVFFVKPALCPAIMRQHVDSSAKLERIVSLLVGFRLYMHYHIKATKSYLHSRMRERVDKLLQGFFKKYIYLFFPILLLG